MQSKGNGRGWFRIHLSTAVVLMVGAGAFLGANVAEWREEYNFSVITKTGWPMLYGVRVVGTGARGHLPSDVPHEVTQNALLEVMRDSGRVHEWNLEIVEELHYRIAINVAIALVALAVVGFGMEWRLRRRT